MAEDLMKTLSSELQKLVSPNSIVGTPIEVEDKTLIVLTQAGLGMGIGFGKGSREKREGEGSGSGAGGGVTPVAVIAVFKGIQGPDGLKVFPLERPSAVAAPIAKAIGEAMPRITEVMKGLAEKKSKEE